MPVVPATGPLPDDLDQALAEVEAIGLPVMLKASWGGGGRGMRAVHDASALGDELLAAKREAEAAFGGPRGMPAIADFLGDELARLYAPVAAAE